jgi:hypothetical protein
VTLFGASVLRPPVFGYSFGRPVRAMPSAIIMGSVFAISREIQL